ncbi:MAG: transcriptional regulator [Armatimonadetes bacterium]|nr:transcriptional regulator [Armatimonadota bacterium]
MAREIDDTIHQKTRLTIISHLAAVGEADFLAMKRDLGLSDGNLSVHMAILENKGYIEMQKSFVGKKTRTLYRITALGRKAFGDYLTDLASILRVGVGSRKEHDNAS